jgi:serine/threonine protein kinase
VSVESLLVRAADEFIDRLNRGEQPDVEEYAARYPEIAALLREMLPALGLLRVPGAALGASDAPGDDATPATGCLGDFRLLREVGRGGMGVVYEAEQISLGRRVALKVLPFAAALDAKQLQRFKNEAQAAAQLHHPHVVPVYGVGCDRGVHYYAMQFIDGQPLDALINELRRRNSGMTNDGMTNDERSPTAEARRAETAAAGATEVRHSGFGFLSSFVIGHSAFVRAAATLGIQAAEALEHAHQCGVVHRDVKPANLLLDGRGHLWVTDFGLAQFQTETKLTRTGDLVGTLRYMSPEQALAQRGPLDHRTDVYALGATLYELLTLELVFDGADRHELLRQIAFDEPRPPRRLNKAVPAELETIVLKALAKKPDERYATAQEMADDLRRFLESRPIHARRPTPWQRVKKWAWRHRAVVTTGAVSFVLILAVAVVLLTLKHVQTRAAYEQVDRRRQEAEDNFELAVTPWTKCSPRSAMTGWPTSRRWSRSGRPSWRRPLRSISASCKPGARTAASA